MKSKCKVILADLDGTINRGDRLIPGAEHVYRKLSGNGFQWVFISNNATRRASEIAQKIRFLGLPVQDRQVVSSASALFHTLSKHHLGAKVMAIAEESLIAGIQDSGCTITSDPFDTAIVVVARDSKLTYQKIERAFLAIQNGAVFWATNLDPTFPVPGGFVPGAGCMVAAVAAPVGRPPDRVFGKPSSDIAEIVLEQLGVPGESCLVVGDRMETDILFARNSGFESALVLTGATSRDDLSKYTYAPDFVLESIGDIEKILTSS
jgi:HAD superfamily hydrolase (TIGR01450 family)